MSKEINAENVLNPKATLLVKLGSLIVHYQEWTSVNGYGVDKTAIDALEGDKDVQEWLGEMDKLALTPKKRDSRDTF